MDICFYSARAADRLKILLWERDGFVLWYKRLEEGVFKLPRIEAGTKSVELRASELAMMLDGIDLRSVRRVKRFSRKNKRPETIRWTERIFSCRHGRCISHHLSSG